MSSLVFEQSSMPLQVELLRLYHSAREAILAYCYCDLIEQRRQIALQIVEILSQFLEYEFSDAQNRCFDSLLSENRKQIKTVEKVDTGLYDILRRLSSEGVGLLGITEEVSPPILKKQFRRASLKYHPDVGGSNAEMQRVNYFYNLFHEAAVSYIRPRRDTEEEAFIAPGAESLNDWLYSIHLVLSCIHGDFFAADVAFKHLKWAVEHAQKSDSPYIGQFAENLVNMGGVLDRACRALGRLQMRQEFDESVWLTSFLGDRIFKDYVPKNENEFKPEREYYPHEQGLRSEYGVKIVLKHPEQARNAYRLGMIDEKRFAATMKRFNVSVTKQETIDNKIDEFICATGFIAKLSDADYEIDEIEPNIVQAPGFYQRRFDDLEDEQKWEYLKAFGPSGTAKLVRKYSKIRPQEMLLGLIHNYTTLDLQKLRNEIDFCRSEIDPENGPYQILHEFFEYVSGLDPSERDSKLSLLRKLDEAEPVAHTLAISITLDGPITSSTNTSGIYSQAASVNHDYLEFAMMCNSEIEQYMRTGERNSNLKTAWNHDLKKLRDFDESNVAKYRKKIWLNSTGPTPEQVIDSARPYLVGLLELGKEFHPNNVGELQIGYEIDRITVAHAKLKQWNEVIYWAELFLKLPSPYRCRSSDGEIEKIRKRLYLAHQQIESSTRE